MMQIVLGVVAGFFGWLVVWIGSEKIISLIWPAGFGVHQRAFQEALITKDRQFKANTTMLLVHLVLVPIVSVFAGFLAARVAGENTYTPLVLGILLVALGVLKAVMSLRNVPVWYHVVFTVLLFSMTFVGGRL